MYITSVPLQAAIVAQRQIMWAYSQGQGTVAQRAKAWTALNARVTALTDDEQDVYLRVIGART